ncbi:MAG: radical SAM protein [candidate division KSB1 bacterium]|nr:radical SAM protein [candidate division KSB1 bacterium]
MSILCPDIDLPIQHISDPILKRMGRFVTRRDITDLILKLRQRIPDLALRTSVITGFPGETEDQFNELLEFIRQTEFERLGVFTYSHEEGTRAFRWMDSVPEEVKRERQSEIMQLQSDISLAKNEQLVGRTVKILADSFVSPDIVSARTVWDAPEIDNSVLLGNDAVPGMFYRIKITSADVYDLKGEYV